jgi:F-type H+-transporting ATPase subunit epsilon
MMLQKLLSSSTSTLLFRRSSTSTSSVVATINNNKFLYGVTQRFLATDSSTSSSSSSSGTPSDRLILNLACPHQVVHKGKQVGLVVLPGVIGEFGVTAGHTPIISELRSGVVSIYNNVGDTEPAEKFFVSGGFSFSHASNVTDINVVECVKLDDLDADAAKRGLVEHRAAMEKAPADSIERAKAQISVEVYEAMCSALGVAA